MMDLGPGEKTLFHMSVNLAHRSGKQGFSAMLIDASGKLWQYHVETDVYETAHFVAPNSTVNLGALMPRERTTAEIAFVVHSPDRLSFPTNLSFQSDLPETELIIPSDQPIVEVENGTFKPEIVLKINHAAPSKAGSYGGSVICTFSSNGKSESVKLNLYASVARSFEVSPAYLVFNQGDEESIRRRVLIRRTDGKSLQVKHIKPAFSEPILNIELSEIKKDTVLITLSIDPKSIIKSYYGHISLTTNHELQDEIQIPIALITKYYPGTKLDQPNSIGAAYWVCG